MAPVVSVCMPVYDGVPHLARSIESLLAQTFADFELIVVDDGSRDGSAAVVERYADPRVRLVKHDRNRGIAAARNTALEASRGEFVAILDCDDEAHPERLRKQLAYLRERPDAGLVAAWIEVIDPDGRTIRTSRPTGPHDRLRVELLFRNPIAQSSVMLRRSAIPEPAYREAYPPAEDHDLWIRIADRHRIGVLTEALVRYRRHPRSTTRRDPDALMRSAIRVATDQLERLGVRPTKRERSIHLMLGAYHWRARWTPGRLAAAEAWLMRLRQANREAGRYAVEAFDDVTTRCWWRACDSAAHRGPEVWRLRWSSPLSRSASLDPGRELRRRIGPLPVADIDTMEVAHAWLLDLADRAVHQDGYPRAVVAAELADRWLGVCRACTHRGLTAYRRYTSSPLARGVRSVRHLRSRAGLLLRCLVDRGEADGTALAPQGG